jgi:hypothetical protein
VGEVFVVLSRADLAFDRLRPEAQKLFLDQWRAALGVERIYVTSVVGYDEDVAVAAVQVAGVEELRDDIMAYLHRHGREIVLARTIKEKDSAATGIIVKAVTRVILGDSLRAVEARAAEQIHYLYTGQWAVTIHPPEIHPAVTMATQLVSLVPYVGRLSDRVVAASTLAIQLVAIQKALLYQATLRNPALTDMQAYANGVAQRMDTGFFQALCEQITAHGPAVLAGGQEYFFEGLANTIAGQSLAHPGARAGPHR